MFNHPGGVATDSAGNVYVADYTNHTIRKITPAGAVTTLAGTAGASGSADGAGAAARFNTPHGIATDSAGNVYVADGYNTIRKITPAGVVTTVAGDGKIGFLPGNLPGGLSNPGSVAISGATLYTTSNNGIVQITNYAATALTGQAIAFGAAPTVIVGGAGTVSATGGASGNAVTFSSLTTGICTVSGSTVTGVAAGACTIAANQAGNASYNAAAQATQSIAVTAPATTTFTVSATAGANGSITPASQSVVQGNTASFTVTPSSGYTASASGCGGSLVGSTYTTAAITANCTVSATFTQSASSTQVSFVTGWNLAGNSASSPLTVATAFSDTTKVTTVWKWVPATSKWAFYAPSMTAPNLATYAAGKGYDVLTTINGGEGVLG